MNCFVCVPISQCPVCFSPPQDGACGSVCAMCAVEREIEMSCKLRLIGATAIEDKVFVCVWCVCGVRVRLWCVSVCVCVCVCVCVPLSLPQLQDGVPGTLKNLLDAGIKVCGVNYVCVCVCVCVWCMCV